MQLSNLIAKNKIIEVEHPSFEGFKVKLAYVSRDTTRKLIERATTIVYNNKTHKPEEELDNALFLSLHTKEMIKGWTGLKLSYLLELLPVELPEGEDLSKELEYSEENALTLMKNSPDFDSWISSIISDVKNFNKSS